MGTNRWNWLAAVATIGLLAACGGGGDDSSAECGNGSVESGETCDDGNVFPGDGCSPICQLELAEDCTNGADDDGNGAIDCDDAACAGSDACPSASGECGDGTVDDGEVCDDGNTDDGDDCSADCQTDTSGGDTEVCDDGTDNDGDGDVDCADADCIGSDACPEGECGDGELNAGEECDDGNTESGDGCSDACAVEDVCGDGNVTGDEECDDGNQVDGDGCESDCTNTPVSPIDCPDGETVVDLSGQPAPWSWTGSIAGSGDDFAPDAACGPVAGTAEETVFYFEAPAAGTYRASTYSAGAQSDTILSVLAASCSGEVTVCNDNSLSGATHSEVSFLAAAGDAFYLVLEARNATDLALNINVVGQQGAEGDACSPADLTRPCQAGLACVEGEGGTFTCQDPAGSCDNPLDLIAVGTGDLQSGGLSATLTAIADFTDSEGTCGGTGAEIVGSLVAPGTGVLEVRVADGSAATVYATPGCGSPTEYGCTEGAGSFTTSVRAGQVIVVVVDSAGDSPQSATLELELFAQGEEGDACVADDPTQGCASPFICSSGRSICVQRAGEGETCDTVDDGPECQPPFICTSGDEAEYCVDAADATCASPIDLGSAGSGAAALSVAIDPDLGTPLYVGSCNLRATTPRTITPSADGVMEIQLGDEVVGAMVRSTCDDAATELACERALDDPIQVEVTSGTPVTLFVDAAVASDLVATVFPIRRLGEACDAESERCELGTACSAFGVCEVEDFGTCALPYLVEITEEDVDRRIDVSVEPDGRPSALEGSCGGSLGSESVVLVRSTLSATLEVEYEQVGAPPILYTALNECVGAAGEIECTLGPLGSPTATLTAVIAPGDDLFIVGDANLAVPTAGQIRIGVEARDALAFCFDGVLNGNESAVDCGGDCVTCGVGESCRSPFDCESFTCRRTCAPASCADRTRNGTETDTDCGGSCDGCRQGGRCIDSSDCFAGFGCDPDYLICVREVCVDGELSAISAESDIDCGGACQPCAGGASCNNDADCASGVCDGGTCTEPTCGDGLLGPGEAGVDCGGTCPRPCPEGVACPDSMACESGVCLGGFCAAPTCSDGVANGSESDIDCGGLCDPCREFAQCSADADCASSACGGDGRCVGGRD